MRYSHFYTIDQWELRDRRRLYDELGQKECWHCPCNEPVYKAKKGIRWVCMGCFTEPPIEIMDVIWLADAYKGWDDSMPNNGASFRGIKFPSALNSFYMSYSGSATESSTDFYGKFDPGSGTDWHFNSDPFSLPTNGQEVTKIDANGFKVSGMGCFVSKDEDGDI